MKNFKLIIWPLIYMALVVAIVGSCLFVFTNTYFDSIFVSGGSMNPTLMGGSESGAKEGDKVNFGLIDKSNTAKNNIKNFDIVTTYYWWDSSDYDPTTGKLKDTAECKIKRVIAKTGDSIAIYKGIILLNCPEEFVPTYTEEEHSTIYFEGFKNDKEKEPIKKILPFQRSFLGPVGLQVDINSFNLDYFEIGKNENNLNKYFVMGDHWGNSYDCYDESIDKRTLITVNSANVLGNLVTIQGVATVYERLKCRVCNSYFDKSQQAPGIVCPKCKKGVLGVVINIKDKQYTYPKWR